MTSVSLADAFSYDHDIPRLTTYFGDAVVTSERAVESNSACPVTSGSAPTGGCPSGFVTVVWLRAALADPSLAAVVFASGSAIRGYVALGGDTGMPAITIGPRTSVSAREHGFEVIAEAEGQSAEELVSAVVRAIPLKETKHA